MFSVASIILFRAGVPVWDFLLRFFKDLLYYSMDIEGQYIHDR